jgi:GNAT superfamily N-acetyltransferase
VTAPDPYPKTVVLADGAHLVLRLPRDGDAPARRALGTAAPASGEPEALVVLACDGERVAGELRLTRVAGDTFGVDVALDPAYRGRRLGTWMLLDAVHAAERLGATCLVAEVAPGDTAFAAALARLDFFDEPPPAPGAVPARGPAVAGRRMAKRLHAGWTDF